MVCFCIARFRSENGYFGKTREPISFDDRVLHMPCFANESAVDLFYTVYEITSAVIHCGERLDSGHYRAMLFTSDCILVTDDGVRASACEEGCFTEFLKDVYLILAKKY